MLLLLLLLLLLLSLLLLLLRMLLLAQVPVLVTPELARLAARAPRSSMVPRRRS